MKDLITPEQRVSYSYTEQLTGVSMRQIIFDVIGFMVLVIVAYFVLYTIGGF